MNTTNTIHLPRLVIATLAAFFVTLLANIVLYGNPLTQSVYYSGAAGQGDKFVAIWNTLQPLPALSANWSALANPTGRTFAVQGLLLAWIFGVTFIFAKLQHAIPGSGLRKGVNYGVIVWALCFVFFDVWTHFNVMAMPLGYVIFGLILNLIISIIVGVTVTAIYKPALQMRSGLSPSHAV